MIAAGMLESIMYPAMQGIVSTLGTLLIVGFVLALGLYFINDLHQALIKVRTKLAALKTLVKSIEGPEDFATRYEDLNEQFCSHELAVAEWKNFRETFLLPDVAGQMVRTSRRAREYFGFEALVAPHLALRRFAAVPGLMTGVGLLGTFVGLAAGVYLASNGLSTGDPTRMQTSLQELLAGASLAFWKSVFAILMSVIFSWYEKRELHRLERDCEQIALHLDTLVANVTPEQLAAESIQVQREQSLQLERFNTELAVSIASALEARLTEKFAPVLSSSMAREIDERMTLSLGPQLQQMSSALERMNQGASRVQEESLQSMVSQFQEQLSGATGDQMAGIAATFGTLNETLQRMTFTLQQEQEGLRDLIELLNRDLRQGLLGIADKLTAQTASAVSEMQEGVIKAGGQMTAELTKAGTNTSQALQQAASKLQDAVFGITQFAEGHETQMRRHQDVIKESTGLLAEYREAHFAMSQAAQPIEAASGNLRDSLARFTAGVEGLNKVASALDDTARQVTSTQQATQNAWQNYVTRFEGVDKSLESVFGEINAGVETYSQHVAAYVSKMDEQMSHALSKLSGAIAELADVVDQLPDGGSK